ncbi:putative chromatin assembly factor 1 subunit A [Lyophyllum shimeji]|uniref:Chromatin assembly factor 1 subunit A n=1 Tax=Lyophyllum shimeji TaxID=47721 RepID=A0A9P3PH95_LYOSH|nr:putative chromatin assembly factor 1 subunit A [Lyophyllum shimeji]
MSGTDDNNPIVNTAATSTSAEPEGKEGRSSLVELKNGKVHFKQKCISFEKQSETLQEIVQFRKMLEERIQRQASPLSVIPEEHHPLIAKLAHESDKTLAALSKHIRQELLPTQDDDEDHNGGATALEALPLSAVENAIKTVTQRNNYGLDGIGGGKAPAAVCVWRWEVKEQHRDWLPKNAREKAESRLSERVQAKQDLLAIFGSLPQEEKDAILDPKGANKLPQKEMNVADASKPSDPTSEEKPSSQSLKKRPKKKAEEENDAIPKQSGSKAARAPKPVDPAKAMKEQEKLEKKAAKAEKEKKERDAQDKSRTLMASFFAKPKKAPPRTPLANADCGAAGPSNIQSEFEKSFKPFVLKKDTELAPINWFLDARKKKKRPAPVKMDDSVIIIDDDHGAQDSDVDMDNVESLNVDVAAMNTNDHLRSIISSLPPPADPSRRRSRCAHDPLLKTYTVLCVRDLLSKLSEAEVAGDDSVVRALLQTLNDRTLLPAKVFIFAEDARPGYFGTWTRNSRIIGPRTPFAKDVLVFDYGYDSGEEWEAEPAGDADDVVDDGEDEEDGDDQDSDLDSWLVDDDEEPGISLEDMEQIPDLPILSTKRKADDTEKEKKLGKKRKVVVPLVPFAKGPCWETSIGYCESSMFDPYRIQLFNDSPFPIDPFTFVSTCVEDSKREQSKPVLSYKPVPVNDGVFVVPSLPERLNSANASPAGPSAASSSSTTQPGGAKRPAPAPKTPFPDVHLPLLLEKIASLQTGSIGFLVEAIHRDLREHKVKKNMIEAKVREVGEKCKEKKFWVVKPGIQAPS